MLCDLSATDGHVLMCVLRIMPAAMVARPWDFPDPPKGVVPPTTSAPSDAKAPAPAPATASTPAASSEKAAPNSSPPPPEAAPGSPASPAPAAHDKVPGVVNPVPSSA